MTILTEKKLFIFDFDGVIADSVDVKTEAFARLYSEFGKSVVQKVVDFHLQNGGMSRFDKIRHFHGELLGEKVTDQLVQDWASHFAEMVVDGVVAAEEIQGVRKILDYCHANRIRCAVNSATPESEVVEIVKRRGLSDDFEIVLGSPQSKVKNITAILKAFGTNPSDAVFFGDAVNDYKAAKLANIDFVGINYNSESEESFPAFKNFDEFLDKYFYSFASE